MSQNQPLSPPETRLDHLDALRLFATVAVITLHATSKQWYRVPIDSTDWAVLNIYDSLVRFCVPVFFMISGALFLDPQRSYPLKKLYRKNISRILVAFVFWSSFYAFIRMYRSETPFTPGFFLSQVAVGHYHLWFLFTLFGIYLMIPLLRKIAEDPQTTLYFLVISFVFVQGVTTLQLSSFFSMWLATWQEKSNIYMVLGYTGYFMLGYYLQSQKLPTWFRPLVHCGSVLALGATMAGTHWLTQRGGVATGVLYNYLLPTTYCVSMSVFFLFQRWKLPDLSQKLVAFLSPLCFGIYLVHDFFLVLFLEDWNWLGLAIPAIFSVPLFVIAVFSSSFVVIWILNWVPLFRKTIL